MTESAVSNGHAEDAEDRVLDALGNAFTPESLAVLAAGSIDAEAAVARGVRAVRHPDHVPAEINRTWVKKAGMLIPWPDNGSTVYQYRPDEPVTGPDGKEHKYLFPAGCGAFLAHWREPEEDAPVLFVEGSKQGIAADIWAPEGWGVVSVPGCSNWVGADLSWAEDRDVVLLFDEDVTANRNVWQAASNLKDALEAEGAAKITFAKLAGARAKEGLDDVLGRREPGKRTDYLRRICEAAPKRLGRAPAKKAENPYFGDKGLLAKTASEAVLEGQPAALASGSVIALYRNGAYHLDQSREPLIEQVKGMLGEDFRPTWRATIEEYLVGELYGRGMKIPDRQAEPILNCANGMLDLRTGEMGPHDPKHLSALQIPVAWDPAAVCPHYEAWLEQVIPDQHASMEETASTMLDPSRTPGKALFAFGPSHSGKSTFLRVMEGVAGTGNASGVSLHQLADNKYMSASVYQKMLNISGDLSSAHVKDISLFKMMTGEDLIEADRKYGKVFRFTNQALFAFSANDLPTVNESSRAYANRVMPYRFDRSFAGSEDPEVERRLMGELPGILVRWVAAWRRLSERGGYAETDPDVASEFETKSDRVARWLATRCDIRPDVVGTLVGPEAGESVQTLYVAFRQWVKEDGSAEAMSRPKFSERLRSVPGVGEVRLRHRSRNPGLNVTTHTGEDRETYRKGANPTNDSVGSVGCVGTETLSLCVGLKDEMIKEIGGNEGNVTVPAIATMGPVPTQPTLPTPVGADAATAFLLSGTGGKPATDSSDFDWTITEE